MGKEEYMKILKNKTLAILIALFLTFSMTASIILQPTVSAHSPPWTIKSFPYLTVAPSPIGVGQLAAVYIWVDQPLPGASLANNIRRSGYTLTITAPDGTVSTQNWATISDSTSIQSYYFTPTQVGNYTFVFNYAGQTYTWTTGTPGVNTAYTGDIFSAATSRTVTLTVQEAPITQPITGYPLPTAYWTYPIEGRNSNWYSIASNWLSTPYVPGAGSAFGIPGAYQPYGSAPNSAHIMWTKPIQYGGVVGGNDTNIPGEAYYQGGSYNVRFSNPIIMQGTLFFQLPYGNAGNGGAYVSWDLKTGQQLWSINTSATGVNLVPSFGYTYSYDSPNQHGNVPNGLLIATQTVTGLGTVWRAYDPMTGVLTTMNVTNVPGGSAKAGPAGEYLKYLLTNYGNTTNPNYYLAQWNSSKVFSTQNSGTFNASLASDYDWNVSLRLPPGTWSIGSTGVGPLIDLGNMALLTQGSFGSHPNDINALASASPANITAISLKPQTLGNVLWTKSYPQAPDDNSRALVAWDPTNGVFVFENTESMTHYGYSLADGSLLWGPVTVPSSGSTDWNYISQSHDQIAYGNLYWCGYSGFLYCFNDKTGDLLWTYGNGGKGNSTYAGFTTPYGYYPVFISAIADGKVYTESTEHSPNSPLYQGELLRAINATTGAEIWTIPNFANQMHGGNIAVASGILVTDNTYDQQIDAFGQGPSQLTVSAASPVATLGASVVIRGTVTDISAGTKQNEQAADFPNGVPAVSDASQSQWMEYVYMQKPRPTDATGVPVTISVVDANGNYREIGTVTSDSSGMFTLTWKPDITGSYTVIATFAGSQSYYGSSSETSFAVDPAAPTAAPTATTQSNLVNTTDLMMYLVPSVIAVIIAIAIATVLIIRKRP
jgi:outer membrane protein assembly factor BamB